MYHKWIEHHFICDNCNNGLRFINCSKKEAEKYLIRTGWGIKTLNKYWCPICCGKSVDYNHKNLLSIHCTIELCVF